jgi:hypothetical protein
MPMPLKAMMANKDRRIPIPNAYALKSDDGRMTKKKPNPKPML